LRGGGLSRVLDCIAEDMAHDTSKLGRAIDEETAPGVGHRGVAPPRPITFSYFVERATGGRVRDTSDKVERNWWLICGLVSVGVSIVITLVLAVIVVFKFLV
jgi:hypothetical protein